LQALPNGDAGDGKAAQHPGSQASCRAKWAPRCPPISRVTGVGCGAWAIEIIVSIRRC
jgi:hypothetical protein